MDLEKLMQEAQKMQESLKEIDNELSETIYEGSSGGDSGVIVKVNGRNEIQEVLINDDLMNVEDKEMLQDMIVVAANDAVAKAAQEREEKLGAAAAGVNIPGL